MDKREFLDTLGRALRGELPASEVESNIRYYEDYFANEIRSGKSEEEITGQLGDPRLIARTIMESYKLSKGPLGTSYGRSDTFSYDEDVDYRNGERTEREEQNQRGWQMHFGSTGKLPWYYKVFTVLVVILVIAVLIAIGSLALSLFINVIIPIILVVILINLIIRLVRR